MWVHLGHPDAWQFLKYRRHSIHIHGLSKRTEGGREGGRGRGREGGREGKTSKAGTEMRGEMRGLNWRMQKTASYE